MTTIGFCTGTWRTRAACMLPFVTAGVTLLLMAMAWPRFWLYINFDDSPMNYYQSSLLFSAAAVAALNARLGTRANDQRERTVWRLIALAFIYLALDEQFMIHETVRNAYLRPYGQVAWLPWVSAGDYLPLLYAATGLSLLPKVWSFIARNRETRWCFAPAIVLAATAVVLDSVDWRALPGNWLGREQFVEECMEAMAYSLIVCAFLFSRDSGR